LGNNNILKTATARISRGSSSGSTNELRLYRFDTEDANITIYDEVALHTLVDNSTQIIMTLSGLDEIISDVHKTYHLEVEISEDANTGAEAEAVLEVQVVYDDFGTNKVIW
jgi:hypothetical protein